LRNRYSLYNGQILDKWLWNVHRLCRGYIHCKHDIDKLHQLLYRQICCNNWGYCLYIMSCYYFRRVSWIECLHCLHCWVILRHDRIVSSDWQLCCWDLLNRICFCLLVLSRRYLQLVSIFDNVFKLRFRIFFNCWCNNLHIKLDHLLSRNILLKWVFDLYELPCRILCRKRWIHKLCCLPCRVILCHRGFVYSDWKLRLWQVFSCISHRMLVLLGWNLHFDCISIKLHELFHGHFRRVSWIECMHGLHCWVILRHCRIVSSDWQLRCW